MFACSWADKSFANDKMADLEKLHLFVTFSVYIFLIVSNYSMRVPSWRVCQSAFYESYICISLKERRLQQLKL